MEQGDPGFMDDCQNTKTDWKQKYQQSRCKACNVFKQTNRHKIAFDNLLTLQGLTVYSFNEQHGIGSQVDVDLCRALTDVLHLGSKCRFVAVYRPPIRCEGDAKSCRYAAF
jgi:hypothetical protein